MNKKIIFSFFLLPLFFFAKSQVIISQYYEGASVNKWIEITNVGTGSINLASPQLKLGLWAVSGSGGNITFTGPPSNTVNLSGTIAPGQSFLIGNTGNGTEVPYLTAASANQTDNTVINFNGNDGVALLDASNVIIDQFGLGINAADISYVRNVAITTPNATYTGSEWNSVARTTVQTAANNDPNYLGYHIPSSISPCTEPQSQPTNLVLTPSPTTITVNFTASVPPADEYLVVRSNSLTLSAFPADGTAYNVNDPLGGGIVVRMGTDTNFIDAGLIPSTDYYYFVFAVNSDGCTGGPNYFNITPLTGTAGTLSLPNCITPPNTPVNLTLTPGSISVSGSFSAAPGANRYLVVRSLNNSLSLMPTNGITYSTGQALGGGSIVSYSANTTFTSLGLTQGTVYYFFVFAANGDCNGEPFYNTTSLNGNATTLTGNGIPPGYYNAASGLNCTQLKTALFNIISANYNQLSYSPGVWDAYQTTDMHRNDANTADIIWDMYSDNPTGPEPYVYNFGTSQCGNYNSEGDCYNREHSFPKSWFNDAYPMYSDINHLFPTDGYVNNKRGNQPYGEVNSPTWTSQNGSKLGPNSFGGFVGVVFEPRNEYKGDFARGQLYMVTRYENLVAGWQGNGNANDILSGNAYPALDQWYINLLYKWHVQDPVSQKEIDRNNAVYALQGNRNPYIDHPEYVFQVWSCTGIVIPVTILDFNAQKNNGSILLQWQATRETSFKEYEIQRSTDGVNFYKTGVVNGRNLTNYDFTDNRLPVAKNLYYRLKMIDIDSRYTYSKIVSVRLNENMYNVMLYPNPAANKLMIKFDQVISGKSDIQVTDLMGRSMLHTTLAALQNNIELDVKHFPAGRYFIRISNGKETINQSFIVIK